MIDSEKLLGVILNLKYNNPKENFLKKSIGGKYE